MQDEPQESCQTVLLQALTSGELRRALPWKATHPTERMYRELPHLDTGAVDAALG